MLQNDCFCIFNNQDFSNYFLLLAEVDFACYGYKTTHSVLHYKDALEFYADDLPVNDKKVLQFMQSNDELDFDALIERNGFLEFFNYSFLFSVPVEQLGIRQTNGLFKIYFTAARKIYRYGIGEDKKGLKIMQAVVQKHINDPGLQLFIKACAAAQLRFSFEESQEVKFDLSETCRTLNIRQTQIVNIYFECDHYNNNRVIIKTRYREFTISLNREIEADFTKPVQKCKIWRFFGIILHKSKPENFPLTALAGSQQLAQPSLSASMLVATDLSQNQEPIILTSTLDVH
jgi:hypothetical protein